MLCRRLIMFGMFLLLGSFLVSGQSFLLQELPADSTRLTVQFYRPLFKNTGMSFYSGIYDLSLSLPVSSRMNIVGSVPLAICTGELFDTFTGGDPEFTAASKFSMQNVSVAMQFKLRVREKSSTSITAGVYAPTAPDDGLLGSLIGLYSNIYQIQKFYPAWSVYGTLAHHITFPNGVLLGLEIGPRLMYPKGGGDNLEYMQYGVSGGYQIGNIALVAELAGVYSLEKEIEDFADHFQHMMSFGAQWMSGSIRPGVYYAIHLDRYNREATSGVLGIKLQIEI